MPLWQWFVDSVGGLLLLVLLYGLCLVVRRRWIARSGGTFDLSLRDAQHRARPDKVGRGWVLGVGRYSGDDLEFFRIFSVSPRAMRVLDRGDLRFQSQRAPDGAEAHALYAGHVVVVLERDEGPLELAMASDALTGFQAWLEAAPPGRRPRPV
jgi:hypothetical protein